MYRRVVVCFSNRQNFDFTRVYIQHGVTRKESEREERSLRGVSVISVSCVHGHDRISWSFGAFRGNHRCLSVRL